MCKSKSTTVPTISTTDSLALHLQLEPELTAFSHWVYALICLSNRFLNTHTHIYITISHWWSFSWHLFAWFGTDVEGELLYQICESSDAVAFISNSTPAKITQEDLEELFPKAPHEKENIEVILTKKREYTRVHALSSFHYKYEC